MVSSWKYLRNNLFFMLLASSHIYVFGSSVHTVFTTECGMYFSWQTLGLVYSHRQAGQPGPLTRLASCAPEQWAEISEEERSWVPTHVAPSFTVHPRTQDVYPAYNKAVAVLDWLARTDIKEDYILIVDADMIMRRPIIPEEEGVKPGWAVSALYEYLIGVKNELAMKHIPEIMPRNDTFAGPFGRRSDQVGGFAMMHRDDLKRVAPLWLRYTEEIREDPDAWKLSGDVYVNKKGDKPWISEMYGYSYACAKADVWHKANPTLMLYPGYSPTGIPKILHYGLYWSTEEQKYEFDKHWHYYFNPFKCPPWDLSAHSSGGLFPHPPDPANFTSKGDRLYQDLLAIEPIIVLNKALCERHLKHCPSHPELVRQCDTVEKYYINLFQMLHQIESNNDSKSCQDKDPRCQEWALAGECKTNHDFMSVSCQKSCHLCTPSKLGFRDRTLPINQTTDNDFTVESAMQRKTDQDEKEYNDEHEYLGRDEEDYIVADGDEKEYVDEQDYLPQERIKNDHWNELLQNNIHRVFNSTGQRDGRQFEQGAEFNEIATKDSENQSGGELIEKRITTPSKRKRFNAVGKRKIEHLDAIASNHRRYDEKSLLDDSNPKSLYDLERTQQHLDVVTGVHIPEPVLRCTRFKSWTMDEVHKCIELARKDQRFRLGINTGDSNSQKAENLHARAHLINFGLRDLNLVLGNHGFEHTNSIRERKNLSYNSGWNVHENISTRFFVGLMIAISLFAFASRFLLKRIRLRIGAKETGFRKSGDFANFVRKDNK